MVAETKEFKKKRKHEQPVTNGVKKETNGTSNDVKKKKKPHMNGEAKKKMREFPAVKHQDGKMWYDYQVDVRIDDPSKDRLSDEKTKQATEEADFLLRTDCDLHTRLMRSGGSESAWLQTVSMKGTASDRLTAMQLQIKQSPVHCTSYLNTLVGQLEKKNVRESMENIPLLEGLFIENLLPKNRKLISFSSRPLARLPELSSNSVNGRKRILVLWMFEHQLKLIYERFTKVLEALAGSPVESLCIRTLKTVVNLLVERPENEQFLLTLLVNKLGHPNKKIGEKVSSFLDEVARRQPAMRVVLVTEVERLIYRRNVSERAQLFASRFLSQLLLRSGESDLAVKLLTIYFGLFKTLVSQKKTDHKLVANLLMGANRAFPYAKDSMDSLKDDIDSLYRLVHQSSFSVAIQTLKLLYQVLHLSQSLSDRYYSSLFRKLMEHAPPNTYHQLLTLLFKTLKADTVDQRVRSFVKRLLQLACSEPPQFASGILVMISRLVEERPTLLVLRRGPLNVSTVEDDESDEETYVDLDDEGTAIRRGIKEEEGVEKSDKAGWVHRKNLGMDRHKGDSLYDPSVRNPLFVSSDSSVDWELRLLADHFHPSVAFFANTILKGKSIEYTGDPINDLTTIAFLDRFVYRNPKARGGKKNVLTGAKALNVKSKEYMEKNVEDIPADEKFLHRYANIAFKDKVAVKKEKKGDEDDFDEDVESVNSEEFEKIMERFEPGEKNDEFDIDFGKEFTAEKQKKGKKRKARDEEPEEEADDGEEDGEDDFLEEWEDEEGDDEEEEEEDEDGEEDEDDVDEDDFVPPSKGKKGRFEEADSSDEDYGDNDHLVSADMFAEAMEDFGKEEDETPKKNKKRKTPKPKFAKKRR